MGDLNPKISSQLSLPKRHSETVNNVTQDKNLKIDDVLREPNQLSPVSDSTCDFGKDRATTEISPKDTSDEESENLVWLDETKNVHIRARMYPLHRQVLMTDDWLNDEHIVNAHHMIAQLNPHGNIGYQEPASITTYHEIHSLHEIPQTRSWIPFRNLGDWFVQILNVGGNHWVAIRVDYIEIEEVVVRVFDSLNSCEVKDEIVLFVSRCLRRLQVYPIIRYQVWRVTQQTNLFDCGLHAIYNVYLVARDIDPASVEFMDTSRQMRNRLLNWFTTGEITPPKTRKISRPNFGLLWEQVVEPMFCNCRRGRRTQDMLRCVSCGEAYHRQCVDVPEGDYMECSKCQQLGPPNDAL
jgi:hypothetical protein